jgi:hypothetical protein
MSLPWWAQLLLGLGGVAGGGIIIYLVILGLPTILVIYAALRGRD